MQPPLDIREATAATPDIGMAPVAISFPKRPRVVGDMHELAKVLAPSLLGQDGVMVFDTKTGDIVLATADGAHFVTVPLGPLLMDLAGKVRRAALN